MDVHRIRFVPVPAPEINALAFSHRSNVNEPTPPQLRLALGRSNGDVEIWNPLGGSAAATAGVRWSQETILRGGKDRTIEGLSWTQDLDTEGPDGGKVPGKLRLFSIGYSTYVTEWDLSLGRPLRHEPAGQSEVWCIAAQPRWEAANAKKDKGLNGVSDPRQEQLIALGCGDGSIVLQSTADGELSYAKTLPRSSGKKPRVMCLAWLGRDKIVAGFSDSMIRVYDITGKGRVVTSMSLGNAGKGKPSETLVWTVKVLRDNTIVSGDSTGEIKIWDTKNYTLLQRLQSHLADVLTLAVSYDGTLLLSGGMDRRTTLHQRSAPQNQAGKGRWAEVSHQRNHQSDVKAMTTFESRNMSVVVSGGLDATPIINPLRTFGQENHRALPSFSSIPTISSAPRARLVLSWWEREASVWRVDRRTEGQDDDDEDNEGLSARNLVARLAVQGEESITSADINNDGDLVVIASMSTIKFFHLRSRKTSQFLRISKMDLPPAVSSVGAKLVRFSPDGKWVSASLPDNSVRIYRLARNDDPKQPWSLIDQVFEFGRRHAQPKQRALWGTHERYDHVISRFAWSSDSRILVAGDLGGRLETWVLEGSEDPDWTAGTTTNNKIKPSSSNMDDSEEESDDEEHADVILGQHWKAHTERLPLLPAAPVTLSFRPASNPTEPDTDGNIGLHATRHNPTPHSHGLPHGEDRLVAVTAKQDILEFNVLSGKLTDWSKRNPPTSFPLAFRNVLDQAMDCIWDVNPQRSRMWLHGSNWLWMFDLSRDMPDPSDTAEDNKKKRKREPAETESRALIKQNAGAGSRIRETETTTGIGLKVRTHNGKGNKDGSAKEVAFEAARPNKASSDAGLDDQDNSDEEEDDDFADTDDEDNKKLVAIRRKDEDVKGQNHDRNDMASKAVVVAAETPHEWHTFKYRPIVGVVPLSSLEQGEDEDDSKMLEVALIERPLWDADLKPRWEGPQERRR